MPYMTIAEKTNPDYHRKNIIIHNDDWWYIAEFDNLQQLENFSNTLGFTFKLKNVSNNPTFGIYKEYSISHKFKDSYFNKIDDLPNGAKKIKALSNGSIVDCYFVNDGGTITIYRPNPNNKEIYIPYPTDLHISHQRLFGVY